MLGPGPRRCAKPRVVLRVLPGHPPWEPDFNGKPHARRGCPALRAGDTFLTSLFSIAPQVLAKGSSIQKRGIELTIDDLQACASACPASGTITATASGMSVSVKFNGSAKATVTGPKGRTFTVPLSCSKG